MLNYDFALSLIFRLLNFGLLTSVLGYLINKYVVESIRRTLAHRASSLNAIEQRSLELQRKAQEFEDDMQQQRQLSGELLKKVVIWKNKVEQQQQALKAEAMRCAEDMARHIELQKKTLESAELEKAVLPRAIGQAENELREKFVDQEKGARYVRTVAESLERM